MSEKGRYQDVSQWRLYPMGKLNSSCARPLSAALSMMRFTPNQVSVLSLLVSIAGLWLVAQAEWRAMWIGGLLVHVGLLLDHADGQVARRRQMGSTWGMYLDMAIDRVIEVGLIVALIPASQGITGMPDGLPSPWTPLGLTSTAMLAAATVGVMMAWRFLTAYNDVLYLRSHLLATGALPAADARPQGLAKRPLMPIIFTRDWVLLIWLVATVLGQAQGLFLLFLAIHVLVSIEKMLVFWVRHKKPEGDARRILGRDYH